MSILLPPPSTVSGTRPSFVSRIIPFESLSSLPTENILDFLKKFGWDDLRVVIMFPFTLASLVHTFPTGFQYLIYVYGDDEENAEGDVDEDEGG